MVKMPMLSASRLQSLLALLLVTALTFSQFSQAEESVEDNPEWFGVTVNGQWPVSFSERSFQSVEAEKKILFIYSKASSAYDQAFATIARSFQQHLLGASYLVVNFRQQPELARQLLLQEGFDLAFIAGSKATSELYGSQINPAMSVVTVTAKDPVLLGLIDSYEAPNTAPGQKDHRHQYAFTSLNVRPEILTSYLQTLNPRMMHIGMIYSSNNSSARTTQVLPVIAAARKVGIDVHPIAIEADQPEASLAEQIPRALATFREKDPGLVNSLIWITGSTLLFSRLEQINQLADGVPVLTAVPDLVSSKPESPMLAIGIGFQSNAALAAVYGRQILADRVTPAQLPVGELSPPDIAINFQKVEESGWRIPVRMFELATILFNKNGQPVNRRGMQVESPQN
ncbi:hypothetical protein M3P05_19610 [Sansalvadorimonas sp. 2012CJ34-2]|uniref:ABC transporter substrate-binding protein n=1 Tax=Parendozoicomonas callyspongiae TaxID=2942213 RepID=A0ABT0PLK9_9GAMM|nr:hypothetical protein [Sansalvadorimonas sp. 2012CJ34-2]MCL6272131.1 hypothetical protein [Sansalvadorimonas sp. 2012CJ34-2]